MRFWGSHMVDMRASSGLTNKLSCWRGLFQRWREIWGSTKSVFFFFYLCRPSCLLYFKRASKLTTYIPHIGEEVCFSPQCGISISAAKTLAQDASPGLEQLRCGRALLPSLLWRGELRKSNVGIYNTIHHSGKIHQGSSAGSWTLLRAYSKSFALVWGLGFFKIGLVPWVFWCFSESSSMDFTAGSRGRAGLFSVGSWSKLQEEIRRTNRTLK